VCLQCHEVVVLLIGVLVQIGSYDYGCANEYGNSWSGSYISKKEDEYRIGLLDGFGLDRMFGLARKVSFLYWISDLRLS
jgi:hypothetical protein